MLLTVRGTEDIDTEWTTEKIATTISPPTTVGQLGWESSRR